MKLPKARSNTLGVIHTMYQGHQSDADVQKLWEVITDATAETLITNDDGLRDRAASTLHKILDGLLQNVQQKIVEYKNTVIKDIPALQEREDVKLAQIEAFKKTLPHNCYDIAKNWIQESRSSAIEWLKAPSDMAKTIPTFTMGYLTTVVITKQEGVNKGFTGSQKHISMMKTDDWWKTYLSIAGGADHFLIYAMAHKLWLAHLTAFLTMIGSQQESIDPLLTNEVGRRILSHDGRWISPFDLWVLYFAIHPTEHVEYLRVFWWWHANEIGSIVDKTNHEITDANGKAALAQTEYKAVVRRLFRIQNELTETRARLTNSNTSLGSIKHLSKQLVSHSDELSELSSLRIENRKLRADLVKLEELTSNKTNELTELREFVADLLKSESEEDIEQAPRNVDPKEPRNWRVIIVGGHERLHSKLRRELPNAVFLHPDQHAFPRETFEHVDAVLFLIGYCSHSLVLRSAIEVRKHNIRAGYSTQTNVESLLEELRLLIQDESIPIIEHVN